MVSPGVAVRTTMMDQMVRDFVRREPEAVVLDLGAGLDGRCARVDPPAGVDWYDIDYPEVVDLRRKVLPHFMNAHDIGADLTDPDWLGAVPGDRPASIVADGLMLFLTQEDMVSMLRRLVAHFPSGELILNAYTSYAMWTFKRSRAMAPIAGGIANPGLNNPRRLEKLVPGLALVDELLLTRTPQVAALPRGPRWAFRAAAGSALLSRLMTTVVLRYRF